MKAFDGATGAEIRSFFAYSSDFRNGVRVTTADLTGDGVPDIVTGAGSGGAPHVKAFDGATGAEIRSFFAFDGRFRDGVNVAAGDVDGDGRADIVTGAGSTASHVKVFSGATGAELHSFFAFPGFGGGVTVAAGDVDGDGFAEIIAGTGAGGPSQVSVFGNNGSSVGSFSPYPGFGGGVRVGVVDADDDGTAEISTGTGPGAPPHVKVFDRLTADALASFFAADTGFLGGVLVG